MAKKTKQARRIRAGLAFAGMTTGQLAQALGVSRSTIHRRLNDSRYGWRLGELRAIAGILEIPLSDIAPAGDA